MLFLARFPLFWNVWPGFFPRRARRLAKNFRGNWHVSYETGASQILSAPENISVDYAVMERATRKDALGSRYRVQVIPAEVGWSDIGS